MTLAVARPEAPRRFYKIATVAPDHGGFTVLLDGRVAKTPSTGALTLPTARLAELVAAEWNAPSETVDFAAMPVTRLAFTAIDRTPAARAAMAGEIGRLIGDDLLCYFAEAPETLVDLQTRSWGPWLEWAGRDLGLALARAEGVAPRPQSPQTRDAAAALAMGASDFALTGLSFAAGLYASAVLAFAIERAGLSGEAAFDLSRLDEAFQEQQWGLDAEAAARTAARRTEARMIGDWFEALNGGAPVP